MPNALCRRIGIQTPIVQAPMAGASGWELALAVSNAGALGSLAAATLSPEAITSQVAMIRSRTSKAFGVNLFVLGEPDIDEVKILRARELLAPFWAKLGRAEELPTQWGQNFTLQLEALILAKPPVASFTFGVLSCEQVQRLHAAGSFVIGTATTLDEGLAWQAAGADAVCAQAAEAGAHRGSFLKAAEDSLVGGFALYRQLALKLAIPVIAAGGIMDGAGVAAALLLGAHAAQLGTAFLSCPESLASDAWKHALADARDDNTCITSVFSGRAARGLVNPYIEVMQAHAGQLPGYPVMNALTTPLRRAAAAAGEAQMLSLWAGQAAQLTRDLPAAELVRVLDEELRTALNGAPHLVGH